MVALSSWITGKCGRNHFGLTMDSSGVNDHWSVAVLTVTVHLHFFPFLIFFFKYVAFCTGFNLLTPIFMLPYIIMDLPIFVIAEWATLLVDIRCPRGGS